MIKVRLVLFLMTAFITLATTHFTSLSLDRVSYFGGLITVVLLLMVLFFSELNMARTDKMLDKLMLSHTDSTLRFMKAIDNQINTINKLKIKIKELEG